MDWNGEWTLLDFFNKTIESGMYPDLRVMIDSQIDLVRHLRTRPKSLLVRGFKQFRSRAYIYQMGQREIAISDNEACCGFYQELYQRQWQPTDLLNWFKEKRLAISGGTDEIPPVAGYPSTHAADRDFVITRNSGDPFRSKYGLKLSHYLPAADKLSSSEALDLRAGRLLSPFNICLTPKTMRSLSSGYTHSIIQGPIPRLFRNDIGETDYYMSILHTLLMERVYAQDSGSSAYQEYYTLCSAPYTLTQMHFDRCRASASDIRVRFTSPTSDLGTSASSPSSAQGHRIAIANQQDLPNTPGGFVVGHTYALDEIRQVLGGSPMPAINRGGGQPTWAKFNCGRSYNPEGPGILGIHVGAGREAAALAWARTGVKIPFFFRTGNVGGFDYLGLASAHLVYQGVDAQNYARINSYPTPGQVALILAVVLDTPANNT